MGTLKNKIEKREGEQEERTRKIEMNKERWGKKKKILHGDFQIKPGFNTCVLN